MTEAERRAALRRLRLEAFGWKLVRVVLLGWQCLRAALLRGYDALAVMERHLTDREFFVGECYSIADIALYAYTHVADEGGFDLERFPSVREWLERARAQPGHVPITMR